jgi:hypothetical protein
MKNRIKSAAIAVLCAAAFASPGLATVYDETVSGDLSNVGTAPTGLTFEVGSNHVFGTSGQAGGVVDRDYFTFTVLPDTVLDGILVLPGTTSIGGGSLSFIAIAAGNQTAVVPTSGSAAGLLGWTHYGPGQIGTDILDDMNGTTAGASGFIAPLGPGDYTVWIQETAAGTANFGFDFNLRSVPEPSTWAMILLGFGCVGAALRRSKRGTFAIHA